ncbi:MAG TPA: hypothetical protein VGD03_02785 [Frankiaceae bacterium]
MATPGLLRRTAPGRARVAPVGRLLSVLTAAALAVDAAVHLRDAGLYAGVGGGGQLGEDTLFRVEAVVALVVAVAVLVRPRPVVWGLAVLVAGSAAGVAILSTYVDLGRLGPIPDLYEPTWSLPGKALSAGAEAFGAATAALALGRVLAGRLRHGAGRRSRA